MKKRSKLKDYAIRAVSVVVALILAFVLMVLVSLVFGIFFPPSCASVSFVDYIPGYLTFGFVLIVVTTTVGVDYF